MTSPLPTGKPDICRITDGLIVPPTHLDLLAVDHCNIKCRTCNHASPLMPAWFADPDTVHHDFSLLAKHYRPAFIKVLGGEPLMHKNLVSVIQAARRSGISDHFTLVTNGVLLDKAKDDIWKSIDEIELSVYPATPNAGKIIENTIRLAKRHGKLYRIYRYDEFRATFSLQGTANTALVGQIYAACKIANLWGCHAVKDGYFYKCPQSIYIRKLTGKHCESDALPISDSHDFQARLLAFLNSPNPLTTCTHCGGTVGRHVEHVLASQEECHSHIDIPTDDIVDHELLADSLIAMTPADDCKIRVRDKRLPPWQRLAQLLKTH